MDRVEVVEATLEVLEAYLMVNSEVLEDEDIERVTNLIEYWREQLGE